MITVAPCRREHLRLLDLSLPRHVIGERIAAAAPGGAGILAIDGWSFAIFADAALVGAAGVVPCAPHRGIAWLMPAPGFRAVRGAVADRIGVFLDGVQAAGMRRIETNIASDNGVAERFARRLGFCREGLMRRYGADGSDHWMYAKVK